MKDRQPTQVLANGAIRYGIYNADGTLDHYEYMKREDAPTVVGTPLNKANLLSDETAAKIWRGNDKPEEPTVNDALHKLADGTAKIGDITITARTDLSSAWLPCDGRAVSQEQYPELCSILRTPASPALWEQKTVSSTVGTGEDGISYANGHWFRSYRDKTSAHVLVSDNGETWTEWTIPRNFWNSGTILASTVLDVRPIKYIGGMYVCSALISCVSSSKEEWHWGVMFSETLFGDFQFDCPSLNRYTGDLDDDSAYFQRTYNDIFFDGVRFFVIGIGPSNLYCLRYTTQLSGRSSPISDSSQAWTAASSFSSDVNLLGAYTRQSDNATVILCYSDLNTSYYLRLYLVKTALSFLERQSSVPSRGSSAISSLFEVNNNVYFFIGVSYTSAMSLYKCTVDSSITFDKVSTYTGEEVSYAVNCNNQIIGVTRDTVRISENIEQGWDYSTSLPSTKTRHPAASNHIVRIPCSSAASTVNDIVHDFSYDSKEIPNISIDTRSKAYIKALEE